MLDTDPAPCHRCLCRLGHPSLPDLAPPRDSDDGGATEYTGRGVCAAPRLFLALPREVFVRQDQSKNPRLHSPCGGSTFTSSLSNHRRVKERRNCPASRGNRRCTGTANLSAGAELCGEGWTDGQTLRAALRLPQPRLFCYENRNNGQRRSNTDI